MKIGVVVGSRSEWDLLLPLARKIDNHPDCSLEIFIAGASPQNEVLWRDVVNDFNQRSAYLINTQVVPAATDKNISVCRTVGQIVSNFAESLFILKNLGCIIVLGGRYESFAAAVAANIMQIPIVHIQGGEITSYDGPFRHNITKMASLHLVATEVHAKRVIQMGEEPNRVFVCGDLRVEALDVFRSTATKNEKSVVVSYGPVPSEEDGCLKLLKSMCNVLKSRNDFVYEIIGPDGDDDHNDAIRNELLGLYRACQPNAFYHDSLSRISFLQILASAKFIIGNSSAGIIEAPALGTTTINVGPKQKGRPTAGSILQVKTEEAFSPCIGLASDPEFTPIVSFYPYGTGGPVAQKMLGTLLVSQSKLIRRKTFFVMGAISE